MEIKIDFKGIDPEVLEQIKDVRIGFEKSNIEAVQNKLGVVFFQIYNYQSYKPNFFLKADVSKYYHDGIKAVKIALSSRICEQEIDDLEEKITLAYLVKILTTELNWPESAGVLIVIFLSRRYGKKFLSWLCESEK